MTDHLSTDTLADHAEGLLGESESRRVAAHLAECDECRDTALVLASLSDVLAADEVGPMPAHFAARIDAALADLYLAEPPLPRPEPVAAAPLVPAAISLEPADNVVDLSSRRKVAVAGLRRVSTVAASMVLLIAGAALGIQTIDRDGDVNGERLGAEDELTPQVTVTPLNYPKKINAPKDAVAGANGSKRDPKTGTVFLRDGRIFKSTGEVLVPLKDGGYAVLLPANTPVTAQPDAPRSTPKPAPTSAKAPATTVVEPPPSKTDGLATGQRRKGASAPPVRETPVATADPAAPENATPPASGGQPQAAKAAAPSDGPYVENSGRTYTEENFAALVMDLVTKAGQRSPNQNTFEQSSTNSTPVPSAPSSARMSLPQRDLEPQDAERGPAPENIQARVERCAAQLKATAIAGDVGMWQGRKATIVVVDSDDPNQVNGFVFYGNCPKNRPVTAQSAQWEQRVNRPTPAPAPAPGGSEQNGQARSRES